MKYYLSLLAAAVLSLSACSQQETAPAEPATTPAEATTPAVEAPAAMPPTEASAPPASAPVVAAADSVKADGKAVFDKLCVACHSASSAVPFSPKITHEADWAPRIKQGKELTFKHAIEGFTGPDGGVMPPKGGNPSLTDDEVKAAVIYMVNESGGQF